MTAARDALLAAVAADPDADLPRLVYADWLDDHGEPDRAEFIRLQCQTAKSDPTDPGWLPAKLREYELFDRHRADWPTGWTAHIGTMLVHRWVRGFPDWVSPGDLTAGANGRFYAAAGEDDGRRLAAGPPVRGLMVGRLDPALVAGLLTDRCRTVGELATPWVYSPDRYGADAVCDFLAGLPAGHWPALRRVRLRDKPSAGGLRSLADARVAATDYELSLDRVDEPAEAAAVDTLARAVCTRAERLSLSGVWPDHLAAVARHPWPQLRRLDLHHARPDGPAELLRAGGLPALTGLTLGMPPTDRPPPDAPWLAVAEAPLAARLTRLDLASWPPAAAVEFCRRFAGRALRSLDIAAWPPDDPLAVADLAAAPALAGVRVLGLCGAVDLTPLADPAVLPELHTVRLAGPPAEVPARLRWRGGDRTVVHCLPRFPSRLEFEVWTADWPA